MVPKLTDCDPNIPFRSSSPQRSSSTATDSTIKSQEERSIPAGQLDPQELARKILEETQGHMRAVESLQRVPGRRCLSTPTTPILSRGARAFQPSETSAFSRPPSRTSLSAVPLSPLSPRPPCRSSSLQKLIPPSSPKDLDKRSTSSEFHLKLPDGECDFKPLPQGGSFVRPSTGRDSHINQPGKGSHLKTSSAFESRLKPSLASESHVKPAGSDSHLKSHLKSSPGSKSHQKPPSSEAHLKPSLTQPPAPITVSRSKTFKAARQHEGVAPASLLPVKKMSTVKKDVLGLLDLSPRHEPSESLDRLHGVDTKSPPASKPSKRTKFPSGYKFLAGHFFHSSKC